MRLGIRNKMLWSIVLLTVSSGSTAFAYQIQFEPRGGVALVRDASVGVAETLDCRAPFTPVEIEVRPNTGGVQASKHFFELGTGEQDITVRRPNQGRTWSGAKDLLRISQSPPQEQAESDKDTSDAATEPVVSVRQEGFGSYLAASISLRGCAYRSHLDVVDGTLALSGEIGRYRLDVEKSFSEILADGSSTMQMSYAATVWETDTVRRGALVNRWPWPNRPEDTDRAAVLGALFLNVSVDHPIVVGLDETGPAATSFVRLNVNVVDARENVPAQDALIEPVSRFAPVEPLTERN